VQAHEENPLEELLRLAADEPAHRPAFCDVLLEAQIFLLGTTGLVEGEGQVNLEAGSQVQIQHWERTDGSPVIPFFSSLAVLRQSIDEEQTYLELPVRSLFEMTLGATLMLNPKSDYGKEFVPAEVEQLLNHGVSRMPEQRVVEKETQVLLGQPAEYPSKLVDSLTQLFARNSNVQRAYLALMHDPSVDEKAHLIIGIEADGDAEKVINVAGNVAGDLAAEGEPVDLCRVTPGEEGLSQYFINETTPFYEKKWGAKLKSFLGFGRA